MKSMLIQRGDTMSGIAQRFHISLSQLEKANPQVKNPNLIFAGAHLNIPGKSDSFTPAAGGKPPVAGIGGSHATTGPSSAGPVGPMPKGQVGDWIKQATSILEASGIPASKMNPNDIATIIQHESGGNPNAQNNWDSNAAAGHPSIGLMQTIQPTFDAHALPGHGNIRNPVDNIIAGVRYAISRYGSISNVPGIVAVHRGGQYVGY